MTVNPSVTSQLSALYAQKCEAGLVNVRFYVGRPDEAHFEGVAAEVLRLEEAIERKEYRVFRFNDAH